MADDVSNQSQGDAGGTAGPGGSAPLDAPAESPQHGGMRTHEARADEGAPSGDVQGHRGRGGPGRGRRSGRGGRRDDRPAGPQPGDVEETVVKVYRCATVVRGGRRFSFAALVVAGDRNGRVGIGYGKANEVPSAVEKASKSARRDLVRIRLEGTTIPHQVRAKYRASEVVMVPASAGTGVIAGDSVRAVLELAGVKDVLSKSYGSTSPKNLVKAAFAGLRALRSREEVARLRNVSLV